MPRSASNGLSQSFRCRFQLLGLGCLRAAMGDAPKRAYIKSIAEEKDSSLDPERFAYISDNTYTAAEVEEFTQVGEPDCHGALLATALYSSHGPRWGASLPALAVVTVDQPFACDADSARAAWPPYPLQVVTDLVPCHLKTAPSSKMFLRSFWHRAENTGVVYHDEMHVYTLARCGAALSAYPRAGPRLRPTGPPFLRAAALSDPITPQAQMATLFDLWRPRLCPVQLPAAAEPAGPALLRLRPLTAGGGRLEPGAGHLWQAGVADAAAAVWLLLGRGPGGVQGQAGAAAGHAGACCGMLRRTLVLCMGAAHAGSLPSWQAIGHIFAPSSSARGMHNPSPCAATAG